MNWLSTSEIVRKAIKQDLSPDNNPFDYPVLGVLENKTNANFPSEYWYA